MERTESESEIEIKSQQARFSVIAIRPDHNNLVTRFSTNGLPLPVNKM